MVDYTKDILLSQLAKHLMLYESKVSTKGVVKEETIRWSVDRNNYFMNIQLLDSVLRRKRSYFFSQMVKSCADVYKGLCDSKSDTITTACCVVFTNCNTESTSKFSQQLTSKEIAWQQ